MGKSDNGNPPENGDGVYPNFGNGNDPAQEEKQIREQLSKILKKLVGADVSEVTNADILQYLRAVNFNFIALSGLQRALHARQSLFEAVLLRIDTKLTQFLESSKIIDEAMSNGPDDPV